MSASTVCSFSRASGAVLAGHDHLAQSLQDILTTPIGSRVMRRDYGSRLPSLIDAPMNAALKADIAAAVAEAVAEHEPRFQLTQIHVHAAGSGALGLTVEGLYLGASKAIPIALGGER